MSWILLVEGQDDQHVISNLLFAHDINIREALHPTRGDRPLLELLAVTIAAGAYNVVAAVIDADSDVASRWQSIRDRLRAIGYALPDTPHPDGTIVEGDRTVGVWLMPDNTIPGKLEDFVQLLIPEDDSLWPYARSAVAAIPESSRRFAASATIKAELHTWLAWQEEPGTRMGAAITKRYLQTSGATADAFVAWVQRLASAAAAQD